MKMGILIFSVFMITKATLARDMFAVGNKTLVHVVRYKSSEWTRQYLDKYIKKRFSS